MKHLSLKLAVLGTLGVLSAQASAGFGVFENLPAAGFSVSAGTNQPAGTTAYLILNDSGNFGSGTDLTPSAGFHDVGATAPASNNAANAPAPYGSYTLAGAATGSIVVNNTYTNGTNVTVGQWNNRLWRRSDGLACVYGYNIVNTLNSDYRPLVSGTQNIEFNDIAYGGFGTLTVNAAYWKQSSASSVVYRAGRTFTAVQHRGSGSTVETGYVQRPITSPAFSLSINGVNSYPTPAGGPTAGQQTASLNSNWVNFTFDVNALDDDGSTTASSPWVYVQTTSCTTGTPATTANAVRLRQTFQELNGDGVTDNPFIEVALPGYIPPGGSVTPTPVSPF